jgi:undecaprenyl-diphosphatase
VRTVTAPPAERRADRRFGTRTVLSFVAVFLVAIPFAGLVFLVTAKSPLLRSLDHDTADALHGYALDHPSFTHAMSFIGAVAGPVAWWVVLTPVFVWLLVARLPRLATFVAVTAIGSSLLNLLIKNVVDRARPHLPDPVAMAAGKSFPSGHTQSATVGFGILVLVFLPVVARRWRIWLWVIAALCVALIGFSRIALGVHYFSDVIGAIVIGSAWLLAMTAAFSAWRRSLHRPASSVSRGLEPEQGERLAHGDRH